MDTILCLCVENWDGEERVQRCLTFSASERTALRQVLLACVSFQRGEPGHPWEMVGIDHDFRGRLSSGNVGPRRWGSCGSIITWTVNLPPLLVASIEKYRLRIQGNTLTLVRHGRAA